MSKPMRTHPLFPRLCDSLPSDRIVPSLVHKANEPKRLPAQFYKTEADNEPVRDWLRTGVTPDDRFKIGVDIRKVEFGWPIGMPTCRPLGKGLWEVRTSLAGNRISRVIFCIRQDCMILLYGFIKKSEKTPKDEIDVASKRKRMLEGNHG